MTIFLVVDLTELDYMEFNYVGAFSTIELAEETVATLKSYDVSAYYEIIELAVDAKNPQQLLEELKSSYGLI